MILVAIQKKGKTLCYANKALQNNQEFIFEAVQNNEQAQLYIKQKFEGS
ncbi:DUF4116 domain-containing protein [Rhabdochlamydiaceae symbiont of Dictyostelium giganteum]